mmetsp:Transcript_818/g.1417  ORF Transcript_818/g.1417 Transcript_818/m.1417 type:complete len:206 (-) Transcript_818:4364-4981(-)
MIVIMRLIYHVVRIYPRFINIYNLRWNVQMLEVIIVVVTVGKGGIALGIFSLTLQNEMENRRRFIHCWNINCLFRFKLLQILFLRKMVVQKIPLKNLFELIPYVMVVLAVLVVVVQKKRFLVVGEGEVWVLCNPNLVVHIPILQPGLIMLASVHHPIHPRNQNSHTVPNMHLGHLPSFVLSLRHNWDSTRMQIMVDDYSVCRKIN